MSQFDVYRRKRRLYVELQSDLVGRLKAGTTVVAPVVPMSELGAKPISKLTPTVIINSRSYVILMPSLSSVSRGSWGNPLCSLSQSRQEIIAAIDLLFTGF